MRPHVWLGLAGDAAQHWRIKARSSWMSKGGCLWLNSGVAGAHASMLQLCGSWTGPTERWQATLIGQRCVLTICRLVLSRRPGNKIRNLTHKTDNVCLPGRWGNKKRKRACPSRWHILQTCLFVCFLLYQKRHLCGKGLLPNQSESSIQCGWTLYFSY